MQHSSTSNSKDQEKSEAPGAWTQALGHSAADKRIDILRGIGRTGSISQAAREAGVSYKAAWQAVATLTNLAGVPLVERVVGGAGGGGARLTAQGEQLLQIAQAYDSARRALAAPSAEGGARA
ncbi:MAG: LysR family transcriptional regulator, partial [Comamonadaceae bacterium]